MSSSSTTNKKEEESKWGWGRSKQAASESNGSLLTGFMKLVGGGGSGGSGGSGSAVSSAKEQDELLSKLILKARETASAGRDQESIPETSSFKDIVDLLDQYRDLIGNVLDKYVGSVVDWKSVTAVAAYYYLEYEDERKNPSWKRRKHRFFPALDMTKLEMANDALDMALIAYADTAEEVHRQLDQHPTLPCDVLAVEVNSSPGKPAHFVALPRKQTSERNARPQEHLHVIVVVRGTKTIADAITDLLCDSQDYRGGKAHSFILESGKYLYDKHKALLEDLLATSGKSKLKLDFIGHSLGAGAASIAGMEFHYNHSAKFDVEVVGFGCPAILSANLADPATTPYIITVINDSDVVPRASGPTVANLILDMVQLDWSDYCQRDAREALHMLHKAQPTLFNRDMKQAVETRVLAFIQGLCPEKTDTPPPRFEVELFPPGRCIHLYRDGSGISGSAGVPNDFFGEIDVSRRMLDDHVFHTGYQQTLLELLRQAKGDHHSKFHATSDEKEDKTSPSSS